MSSKVTSEVRSLLLKIKEFMDEEKRMRVPIIPLNKVYVRVAAATGVSERTVLNIVKEAKLMEQGLLVAQKTPKKRIRTKGKIELSEYDLQVMRCKIHEFYTCKKEVPTVIKLLNILKEEINFNGSRETLRKILRKNGFQFKKTKKENERISSSALPMVAPYMHDMFSHKNI